MYDSNKSDLLKRINDMDGVKMIKPKSENSAIIFDLSVIVNTLSNWKSISPKHFKDSH